MKKLVSFIVCSLLVFCMFSVSAKESTTLTVGDVEAYAGQTVTAELLLSGNSGIASLVITPDFDFVTIENGEIFPDFTLDRNALFLTGEGESTVLNGKLATVTFTIPEDAKAGECEIKFTVRECFDENLEEVEVNAVAGTLTVLGGEAPVTPVETPTDETPIDETPTDVTPSDKTPADNTPVSPKTADAISVICGVMLLSAGAFVAVRKKNR